MKIKKQMAIIVALSFCFLISVPAEAISLKDYKVDIVDVGGYWRKIVTDGEKYLMIGGIMRGIILSHDGVNWEIVYTSEGEYYVYDLIWDGEKFVGTVTPDKVIVSYDGYNWDTKRADMYFSHNTIFYNGDVYVTGGFLKSGGPALATSANGVDWNIVPNENIRKKPTSGSTITDIAWNGKRIVGVGTGGTIFISDDAVHWEEIQQADGFTAESRSWITYDGKQFITGYPERTYDGISRIIVSKDGVNWTTKEFNLGFPIGNIRYINGKYYSIAFTGEFINEKGKGWMYNTYMAVSDDMVNWELIDGVQEIVGNKRRIGDMKIYDNKMFLVIEDCLVIVHLDWLKSNEIPVFIDGRLIDFDVAPTIINGRTMVPMRKIFEELGAEVNWDDSTKTVTSIKDGVEVVLQIGNKEAYVNNELNTLDVEPVIVGNRTMIPLRFVAESFGCKVDWNNDTRTVSITTNKKTE